MTTIGSYDEIKYWKKKKKKKKKKSSVVNTSIYRPSGIFLSLFNVGRCAISVFRTSD